MATNLSNLVTALRVQLNILATRDSDLSTPIDTLAIDELQNLTFGDGEDENDQYWHDQITLTASQVQDLDLTSLTNAFGTVGFGVIKGILIILQTEYGEGIEVGGDAVDPFQGWFGNAADTEIVEPGFPLGRLHLEIIDRPGSRGCFALAAPAASFAACRRGLLVPLITSLCPVGRLLPWWRAVAGVSRVLVFNSTTLTGVTPC